MRYSNVRVVSDHFRPLRKMVVGGLLASLSFLVTGFVQLSVNVNSQLESPVPEHPSKPSAFWAHLRQLYEYDPRMQHFHFRPQHCQRHPIPNVQSGDVFQWAHSLDSVRHPQGESLLQAL